MHGNNERIALENLKFGMRMLTEVLKGSRRWKVRKG